MSHNLLCASSVSLQPTEGEAHNSVEISKDLWKDALVPDLPPSFTACSICRQYSLSISAEFADGRNTVEVLISDPPHSALPILLTLF
jgi:hypothetical protein